MKRRTGEWIEKAEGDWKMAQREMKAPDPVWDGICFHAQPCAEKYVKALLEEHNIAFSKTHDLDILLNLGGGTLLELESLRAQLKRLSPFSIAVRYPGEKADRPAAEEAMRTTQQVRKVVRARLGLH